MCDKTHACACQTEANEALHKARQNEHNLKNQISELLHENSELDQMVAEAHELASDANFVVTTTKQNAHNLQNDILQLKESNSMLQLEASSACETALKCEETSNAFGIKRTSLSKDYRDLAAQMVNLKNELSRCSVQGFASIVIDNLNATITKLNQLQEVQTCFERVEGSCFLLPLQKKEWDDLRLNEFDSENDHRPFTVWGDKLQLDQQLQVQISDLDKTDLARCAETSKIFDLRRDLEKSRMKMHELQGKLDWQQSAGDAAALELGCTLKLLRLKEAEITQMHHALEEAPDKIKNVVHTAQGSIFIQFLAHRKLVQSTASPSEENGYVIHQQEPSSSILQPHGHLITNPPAMASSSEESTMPISRLKITDGLAKDSVNRKNEEVATDVEFAVECSKPLQRDQRTSAEEMVQVLSRELRSLAYRNKTLIGQIAELELSLQTDEQESRRVQLALEEQEKRHIFPQELLKVEIQTHRNTLFAPETERAYIREEDAADRENLRVEVDRLQAEGCSDKELIAKLSSCEDEILTMIETLQSECAAGEVTRKYLEKEVERGKMTRAQERSVGERDAVVQTTGLSSDVKTLQQQNDELERKIESLVSKLAFTESRAQEATDKSAELRKEGGSLRLEGCIDKKLIVKSTVCEVEISQMKSTLQDERVERMEEEVFKRNLQLELQCEAQAKQMIDSAEPGKCNSQSMRQH